MQRAIMQSQGLMVGPESPTISLDRDLIRLGGGIQGRPRALIWVQKILAWLSLILNTINSSITIHLCVAKKNRHNQPP